MNLPRTLTLILLTIAMIGCAPGEINNGTTKVIPEHFTPPYEPQRISPAVAWEKVRSGALLIDVRTVKEYEDGHFKEAINIPHDEISTNLERIGSDRSHEIVLHCKSGRRASLAAEQLAREGYKNVYNSGGYAEMLAAKSSD